MNIHTNNQAFSICLSFRRKPNEEVRRSQSQRTKSKGSLDSFRMTKMTLSLMLKLKTDIYKAIYKLFETVISDFLL